MGVFSVDAAQLRESDRPSADEVDIRGARWYSAAASEDTLVVGVPKHHAAPGTSAERADVDADGQAPASVQPYRRSGETWVAETALRSPEPSAAFGWSVALEGDLLAVGAPDVDVGGSVFIFEREQGKWVPAAKLRGSALGTGDGFGFSLAACAKPPADPDSALRANTHPRHSRPGRPR